YALAQDADWLYFSGVENIVKLPKAGGNVQVLTTGVSPYASSLSVDENAIYWVDPGDLTAASNGPIMRAPLGDGAQQTLAEGLFEPNDLARHGDDLVFITTWLPNGPEIDGHVSRVTGGARTDLVTLDRCIPPSGIANDGESIFWVECGQLMKMPIGG